ncbi:hypothetical protein QBC40DRAFT_286259 [Triangularia verruculosa]|uniref:Uncharacterized protein n=1 Tax=Triangularia verruculosa TaxID=2587418 RepID=A0AAN6XAK6_9PEZI|nr:hypothetical protein QBC40DRAFT_286259 [Triangularia verruculosa]
MNLGRRISYNEFERNGSHSAADPRFTKNRIHTTPPPSVSNTNQKLEQTPILDSDFWAVFPWRGSIAVITLPSFERRPRFNSWPTTQRFLISSVGFSFPFLEVYFLIELGMFDGVEKYGLEYHLFIYLVWALMWVFLTRKGWGCNEEWKHDGDVKTWW